MPPILDAGDIYAADRAGNLSPVVKSYPHRIYAPNSKSNSVTVIDAVTYQVIDSFLVGHQPQHVTPSYDLKSLWVLNDKSNSLTRIDPETGKPSGTIAVTDPYNMYYTPDGRFAIVVAEQRQRANFLEARSMRLFHSLAVPCKGVDHMDFSADGTYLIATCEFDMAVIKVDVQQQNLIGCLMLEPHGMPQDVKLSPDGKVFYVADMKAGGVHLIDGQNLRQIGFIPTGKGAVEAGHQALNQMVLNQIQQFVTGIDLVAVAAEVQETMMNNPGMSQQDATIAVVTNLLTPVQNNITQFAPAVVESAIINNGGVALSEVFNGTDQPAGQFFQSYSQTDLAQTSVESPIVIAPFMTGDSSPFPDWGFNLHGEAYERIEVWTTPLPDFVPPGRWRVTGVLKARVSGSEVEWITHIGGQLGDGTPWLLTRAHAAQLIEAGTNSFFVHGDDGSQADVQVIDNDPHIHHAYLKTVPDGSLEDNLSQLPPSASVLVHTQSV